MKKFNKSLLTAAVVGALALPALASAASLAYPTGKQIWFAKDLIVNNGTTINTPSELTLSATIDDATRIRALKIYERHNQANAIDFVDHVIVAFPFRIQEIRTDNGHEFQAKFHWHVEDKGMRHAYIKPSSPQLNGKVERSHRSDQQEFYQLLSYTGDVDLNAKLAEWEKFYNFARPHGAHNGKTPYEALREKL